MDIVLPHQVIYDFDEPATISEVIKSLKANEKLIADAIVIFQRCLPGVEVPSYRIELKEINQGSPLKELIAVSMVIGFQEDLEDEVPDIIKALTGVNIPEQYDTVLTVLVVAAALYGGLSLIEVMFKRGKASSPGLSADYDRTINVAGDLIQVPSSAIDEAVQERMSGKRRRVAAKTARDFFLPAKRRKARSIKSSSKASIGSAAISEIPSELDEEDAGPVTDMYVQEKTIVEFRAHDLDSEKSGWAAVVREAFPKRRKLHLAPDILPMQIFGKTKVVADVQVHLIEQDDGEMEPFLYILEHIYDDEPKKSP